MKTSIAQTSLDAYRSLQAEGSINTQEAIIYLIVALSNTSGLIREEIADATGFRLSAVCGRVNELIKRGELIERGTRINPHSGKANKVVCRPMRQLELI